MGIFDDIKRIVTGNTPRPARDAPPARHAPPTRSSAQATGLPAAQKKRRASGEVRGVDGKVLTDRRLKKYESLERAIVADAGAFPWSSVQARAALARRGFDAQHVEAYLASPAARRLLE